MFADMRRIAGLAWPVLIGQLAIIAFGLIDTVMAGRYSAVDLAALGLGSSIYVSVYVGLTGVVLALQPIAGQLFGARREAEIGEQVRQALWLAAALAVLGFTLMAFPGRLLAISHVPPALYHRTELYLRIAAVGLPAALVFRVYSALANAVGMPRLVMILQIGALGAKIALNFWFVFGGFGLAPLGGPGCALASTVINFVLAAIGITLLARLDVFAPFGIFSRFSWPNRRRQAELLKLGLPMGLSYLIEVTSYAFMALFIARFGTTTLAGHQIIGNFGAALYMTPMSIGIATSTLVAHALGAHRYDAARSLARHGMTMAFVIGCCYAAIAFILRPAIIAGYTPNPAVIAAAMPLMPVMLVYHVFDTIQTATSFVLRAYRVAVVPTVIYAVALWGVGLGGGYWLGFNVGGFTPAWLIGARGFWAANAASLAVAGCGLFIYWRSVSTHFQAKAIVDPVEPHLATTPTRSAHDETA
ncbi:MAG TPA: MATE family efflux transporter [Trinickia sp.]|uniref:MATE family efflux transporter n=1 Tax=Trinickia sp. TaxID=2571163 RepID=UPI002B84F0F3|nr:MATE family efflux transporter [Trinickia sp.]HTI16196.1 MATE family efflux transporter [Trinickia sp.]